MVALFNMTYIRHDVDASCDPKSMALIAIAGFDGYGKWWALLELMARSSEGFIDLEKPGQREVIEWTLRLDDCDEFLNMLAQVGLIDSEMLARGKVMSNSFLQRREEMLANFENGRKGGRPKKEG